MAKVFKGDGPAPNVLQYGREALEEFPDAPRPSFDLPEEVTEEEEPPPDPEAIRAAVMEEARAEAEVKVREASEAGYQRGLEKGQAVFEESIAECAASLHAAAEAMQAARRDFLDGLEPQAAALATLIAERVLQREVRTDPDLILATARRALEQIADRQQMRLRVNPADLAALREHEVTLLEGFEAGVELHIEADDAVAPGDCLVDSQRMHVEARMERMLADVLDALDLPPA